MTDRYLDGNDKFVTQTVTTSSKIHKTVKYMEDYATRQHFAHSNNTSHKMAQRNTKDDM